MKLHRLLAGVALAIQSCSLSTAAEHLAAEAAKPPVYPRVTLAPQYEVVRGWPTRPPGVEGAAVSAIALDRDGNVWLYTRKNPTVQVYTPDGRYVRGWTEPNPKTVPHGLKFDRDGNVWLVDVGLHVARKFSPDGHVLQVLGTMGEPGEDATHFFQPTDIAFAPNGDIFVSDGYGNNRVAMFDKAGKFLKQVGKGKGGPEDKGNGPGEWVLPHKLAVDAQENLYIIDREGHRLQVYDKNLNYLREIKIEGWNPWDIGISRKGDDGFAYIADHALERMHKLSLKNGKIVATWGKQGLGPGEFDWVHGVVVDSKGAVYAADTYGQRIQKFVPSGTPTMR